MERKVIVIAGPTCSGKTQLCLYLSEIINIEVISADSRQIYKKMNIGTAKPSPEILQKVKHHFIDSHNPDEDFNISIFEKAAEEKIREILKENKIPVVAGGSGLYIKALIEGIADDIDTDEEYRNELHGLRNKFGNEYLYNILKEKDPAGAQKMLPSNWKRVMRALEVLHISGKPIWYFHSKQKPKTDFQFLQFGLLWQRDVLYKMIEERTDKMIKEGLVSEVQEILKDGYNTKLNALNTVGYKEIIEFIENKISLERAAELIKRNTRRYAKRQMTWFRKDERIKWIDINGESDLKNAAGIIAETYKLGN